jgi:predicted Zn finger-like uncharacterized protein
MIIICEECGKKYRVDPAKIKGKAASFKCRICAQLILVSKAQLPPPEPAAPDFASQPSSTLESTTDIMEISDAKIVSETGQAGPETAGTEILRRRRAGRFGLRAKMLMLFVAIPMVFMAGAGLFYIWQIESSTDLLVRESARLVNQMAEEKIGDISAAVAMQCKLYLLSHPELKKEDFSNDMGFKFLAVQKVGQTGYTALYQLPGTDGVWRTWAHINPEITAIDMSSLKKNLKENFAGFWKIIIGVKGGRKSQGYYTWQDKDEKFRDKFMVCTPIAGTRFVIAATTYLDEFTGSVRLMESNAKAFKGKAKIVTLAILGATLLLIALIVSIYGQRLAGKIKSLTEIADRIRAGEFAMEIETKSKDEIGDLAEAIAGMQDSIRLSIKRFIKK